MDEDEYLEENDTVQNIPVADVNMRLIEQSSIQIISIKNAPIESESLGFSNAIAEDVVSSMETRESVDRDEPSLDKSDSPNLPGIQGRADTPETAKRITGRQKNLRARKCAAKPNMTVATINENVYSEKVACGWSRCYSSYRKITKEEAVHNIDPHSFAKVQASAAKTAILIASTESKGKRKEKRLESEELLSKKENYKRIHAESSSNSTTPHRLSERSLSPTKVKSPSNALIEVVPETNISSDPVYMITNPREKSEPQTTVALKKEHNHQLLTSTVEKPKELVEKITIDAKTSLTKQVEDDLQKTQKMQDERMEKERRERKKEKKRKRELTEEENTAKQRRETESMISERSNIIDINGWSNGKIFSHFGLQTMVVSIKNLSDDEINAALAFKPQTSNKVESPKRKASPTRKVVVSSNYSPSSSPRPSRKDRSFLNSSHEPEFVIEMKKKIERSVVELIASPSSPPPPRSPSPETSLDDIRKKSKSIVRKCVGCQKNLHDCVDQWYKDLGAESQYCSVNCIESISDKIKELHSGQSDVRIPMVSSNNIIRRDLDAPTINVLAQYIRQSSAFIPLCLSEKSTELENAEKEDKAKAVDKASKFLSKESDILRSNFKVKIGNELFAHGRLILKKGMIECRQKAAEIEKEIFKISNDVNSAKYRFFSEKFNVLFKQYRNFASKVNAGYITVQKLSSLEESELVDFARNSNVSLYEDNEADTSSKVIRLPSGTDEPHAATQEIAKHIQAAPPPKMGRIPKKPKEKLSTLDSLLGDGITDTTSQHNSHFYDKNCSICAGKAKEKAEKEKRETEEREKFREQEKQRIEKTRTYGDKSTIYYEGDKKKELKRFEKKKKNSVREDEKTPPLDPKDPLGLNNPNTSSPKRDYGGYNSDDGDDYGGGSGSPQIWDQSTDGATATKSTFDGTWRTWRTDDEVWRGQMIMGTITFVTSLKAISNKAAFEMRDNADLPVTLNVKGRIKELVVFEYLNGLRKSQSEDVIVLKMEKPLDFEFEKRFMMMYTDMVSKERYQVIDFGSNRRIKDGYLLPIRTNQEAPPVLLPWKGPGFPNSHPEMILCVIIRNRHRPISMEKDMELSQNAISNDTPNTKDEPQKPDHTKSLSELSRDARPNLEESGGDMAARSDGDYLSNPKFFENLKMNNVESAPEVVKPTLPQNITQLAQLLQFINYTENPRLIKSVVAQFVQDPNLDEKDREVIRVTVMNKIKRKRMEKGEIAQTPPVVRPAVEQPLMTAMVPVAEKPAALQLETSAVAISDDEYCPNNPNEWEEQEKQNEEQPKPLSPSDFDSEQPSTFMNIAGELLSQFTTAPPVPPTFASEGTPNTESNSLTPKNVHYPVSSTGEFVPPVPQALLLNLSVPQIPLPSAPNASVELTSIPPPAAFSFNRIPSEGDIQQIEIPVLGGAYGIQDISEANSVEAIIDEDSPIAEDPGTMLNPALFTRSLPPPVMSGPPMNAPPPSIMAQPYQFLRMPQMSMAPGPMMQPSFGPPPMMHMQNVHSGPLPFTSQLPPPAMNMPPPVQFASSAPPQNYPVEVHGSAGFKGLAPSLGGKGNNNSMIDFFNSAASTSRIIPPQNDTVTSVVIPARAEILQVKSNLKNNKDSDDDNIPRTPTPPPRPGIRSGVRPGARRVLPGARLPPRLPSPEEDELEIMQREERRRLRALQREEENLAKQAERTQMKEKRDAINRRRLGKLPTYTPLDVVNKRVEFVAKNEGISMEEANKIVREQHMLATDEEISGSEAEDLVDTRGIKRVRAPMQKGFQKRPFTKTVGFAYQHSTGSVALTKQPRAVNVDYDDDGNEIVPDDLPESDDAGSDSEHSPVSKEEPEKGDVSNGRKLGADQLVNKSTGDVPSKENNECDDYEPIRQQWPVDKYHSPGSMHLRNPPPDWTQDDYYDGWNQSGPSPVFRHQEFERRTLEHFDPYYDGVYNYPSTANSEDQESFYPEPPMPNNRRNRGRGRIRGYGPPSQNQALPDGQRSDYGGPLPFRGRAGPPPPNICTPGLPPGAMRGHPYYNNPVRKGNNPPTRGHPGSWDGGRNMEDSPFNGPPFRGHSSNRGGPLFRGHPPVRGGPPSRGHPPPPNCGVPPFRGHPPPAIRGGPPSRGRLPRPNGITYNHNLSQPSSASLPAPPQPPSMSGFFRGPPPIPPPLATLHNKASSAVNGSFTLSPPPPPPPPKWG